jgi:hypothetical protein
MTGKERLRLPVLYYSLNAAANELDIEKEYLIQWIKEGKIRACMAFDSFEAHGTSVGFVHDECDLKKAADEYQDQYLDVDHNEYYLNYINEPDYNQCVLNKIFATEHSYLIVNSCYYSKNEDNEGFQSVTLEATLRGLWQINTREEAIKLLSSSQEKSHYIHLVPYIQETFYSAKQMKGNSGIISGFEIQVNVNNIKISRDDMERLYKYLHGGALLTNLDGQSKILEKIKLRKPRSPSKQMNMVVIQLIAADPSLGSDILSQPYKALDIINAIRIKKELAPLEIEPNTLGDAIKVAKKLLNFNQF